MILSWTILSVGSVYVYIYIWFSAFSMVYFIRWRMNINNFISIYSSKKETSLVSLVCWNILSVRFMYIYIGFLHPPWSTVSNKEWTFNVSIWISVISLNFIFYLWNQIRIVSSKNMMLSIYIYIFVEFSFLNGLQKSTDRIFRLAVPALLAATGHIL